MLHLTSENFEIKAKQGRLPTIVMFYAAWCGKCAMMKPVIEDIEKKHLGRVRFCEVDIDESEDLAGEYEADIVPTFIFFKGADAVAVLQGIISQDIFEKRMKQIFHMK